MFVGVTYRDPVVAKALILLQVFNLFNLIIERLGDNVKPYGPGILQLLPTVWQQAEGQSLLRIQACTARLL